MPLGLVEFYETWALRPILQLYLCNPFDATPIPFVTLGLGVAGASSASLNVVLKGRASRRSQRPHHFKEGCRSVRERGLLAMDEP